MGKMTIDHGLYFWLFLLLICVYPANAQSTKDTAYIESFSSKLIISSRLFVKDYQINFQSDVAGKLRFQNANLNAGLRIKYKKLGLSLSFPLTALHAPTDGEPKHLGVALNFYEPRFFLRAGLRRFNGFTQLATEPNRFREDMHMWHGIARGFYVFNYPRYSLRSTFKLSERQKKSQGSWLLSGLLSTQILKADSLVIPTIVDRSLVLDGYKNFKAGIGGGYAHTFTHGRWFFTAVVTGGGEFRHIRFISKESIEDRTQWRVSPRINAQAGCGYNGQRFFVAVNGFYLPGADFADALNVRVEDTQINLMVGWRFQQTDALDVEE